MSDTWGLRGFHALEEFGSPPRARATFCIFHCFLASLRFYNMWAEFRADVFQMVPGVARDELRGFHALEGLGLRGFHALEEIGSPPMARTTFLQNQRFAFSRR